MSRIDESRECVPVRIAVLTVSDTRSIEDDRSGQVLVDRIERDGHLLADRAIVRDDRAAIARGRAGSADRRAQFHDPLVEVARVRSVGDRRGQVPEDAIRDAVSLGTQQARARGGQ